MIVRRFLLWGLSILAAAVMTVAPAAAQLRFRDLCPPGFCPGEPTPPSRLEVQYAIHGPVHLAGAGTLFPGAIAKRTSTSASYAVAATLPVGVYAAGLHSLDTGDLLFSPLNPVEQGGRLWYPFDIVRRSAATQTYSCFFDGSAAGIPPSSRIDAFYLVGGSEGGSLVVSFDTPTILGNTVYGPSDLVRFNPTGTVCTGWTFAGVHFSAANATPPIPPGVNVVAADSVNGRILLGFDLPITLGATTYRQGDLIAWDRDGARLFMREPGWPAGIPSGDVALRIRY